MNDKNIDRLFEMFSGMYAECCQMFIMSAKRNVFRMTKQEFRDRLLLDFLTASIACADWKRTHNLICEEKDRYPEHNVRFAENLVNAYMELCYGYGFLKEVDEHEPEETD